MTSSAKNAVCNWSNLQAVVSQLYFKSFKFALNSVAVCVIIIKTIILIHRENRAAKERVVYPIGEK